jgi:uncharacterized protein
MPDRASQPCTAFAGQRRLTSGPLGEVALEIKVRLARGSTDAILVFDDTTGCVVDLNLSGSHAELAKRLSRPQKTRGRGRPKLGVVAREVTLLPRQWDWLSTQPGGASAILRRLVDEAARKDKPAQQRRAAQEAAYHFMLAIAGNLPSYEEALRALFADNIPQMKRLIVDWPRDIREHALKLARG